MTSVPPPQNEANGARFTPCRDAAVVIRAGLLTVNGTAYGPLAPRHAWSSITGAFRLRNDRNVIGRGGPERFFGRFRRARRLLRQTGCRCARGR